MRLDLNQIREAGYQVEIEKNFDGEVQQIHIYGDNTGAMDRCVEALQESFPEVDSDLLVTAAGQAVQKAVGYHIIEISSKR